MTKIDRIMEIIKDYSYLKEDLNAFQFTYLYLAMIVNLGM